MSISYPILRNTENVTDFFIGEFQDKRLMQIGALLAKRICSKMTVCIKKLAANSRALEVGFGRFLRNKKVTVSEIETHLAQSANNNCIGIKHVLNINDTVEVAFPSQREKKTSFGPTTGNKKTKGFFSHPGVVLNAENGDVLGISSVKTWIRAEEKVISKDKRKIEEKESHCWIEAAVKGSENLTNAELITHIGDRESDIYELFDRVPNKRNHIIARSKHDRKILGEKSSTLCEHMDTLDISGTYEIDLPEITGVRKSRRATIAIKFSEININRPKRLSSKNNKSIKLSCIEAIEVGEVPKDEESVYWRLLTTHTVHTVEEARQIIIWYTWRWTIEQIFRTMKKKGLNIEESQMEDAEGMLKLFVMSFAMAVKVLCLVHARGGKTDRPASNIFNEKELIVLEVLLSKLEGKTLKQQNPYRQNTLSWASWIIARLGSWTCYGKPPGPITMYEGLKIFEHYFDAWLLFQ